MNQILPEYKKINKDKGRSEKKQKDKVRVFIAVKLPLPVVEQLAVTQNEIKSFRFAIRWTRPENIHLTLKFLGDISKNDIEPVCKAVETASAGFKPISLFARGVGVFPGVKRPRVLWTGMSGETDQLLKLQVNIDKMMASIGFKSESRTYKAHLTLGRFKGNPDIERLLEVMGRFKDTASEKFLADAITVFQSDLRSSGPVYSELGTIKLPG